ncbi:MAG: hypothetical protein AAGF11_00805 [Myxococcota bacterium]
MSSVRAWLPVMLLAAACASPEAMSSGDDSPHPVDAWPMCTEDGITVDYQTRYLRLVNHTGGPVCAGTLDMLDTEVERLVGLMGLPIEAPFIVDYGVSAAIEACEYDQGSLEGGCVRGYGCETRMSTSYAVQVHELVHAIRQLHGIRGPSILEEGLAVILGNERPSRGQSIGVSTLEPRSMLELLELSPEEVGVERYAYGAHFLSFLMDEYGQAPVLTVLSDPGYPSALSDLFEAHLGESLEQLDERWRKGTWETRYTTLPPCHELVPLGAGFDAEATLDCSDAGTLGHFGSYVVSAPTGVCFTTDEPSPVTVWLSGTSGSISLLGHDCHPDDLQDPQLETGFTITATMSEELNFTLARCTWLVDFVSDWSQQSQTLGISVVPR